MGALALCLGFTSCDGYEEPNPPAQSNPQESIFEIEGIKVTDVIGSQVVDVASYINAGQQIPVLNVELTDFPASSELNMVLEFSTTEDFARVITLETAYEDGVVTIDPDAFQTLYTANVSKGPKQKTLYFRYAAYAVNGNESVRLGNPELYFGPFAVEVLPVPSDFVIEDRYYLLGTINGWSVAEAIELNHSDLSPYDDPVFSIPVSISGEEASAGWWWKIIPESTFLTGNWVEAKDAAFGPEENGDDALVGMIVGRTADDDCGAGCIIEQGNYILTINMEDMTYEFSEAYDNFYTPGTANGWSFDNNMLLYTNDYTDYYGYVVLSGEFKFTSTADWSAKYNLGAGDETGVLVNGSNTNCTVSDEGLYWVTLNLPNLTYTTTLITAIGVIGDFNGWAADVELTPSADWKTWTGDVEFTDSGEFKFRANNGWDINLGDSLSDLQQNGGNIATPGAGTYEVTLNLGSLPYTATIVKK